MIDMVEILYGKIRPMMESWKDPQIYAVSFFVYSNECYEDGDFYNVPIFEISYNTESDCGLSGPHSERRWNYAFWRQDTTSVIDPEHPDRVTDLLFDWFREQGIEDPGAEEPRADGPEGFLALVELAGKVARRFQDEGLLRQKFGRPIPILVHDLEYAGCTLEATEYANPNGEAADFLAGDWDDDDGEPEEDNQRPDFSFDRVMELRELIQARREDIRREMAGDPLCADKEKLDALMKKLFGES